MKCPKHALSMITSAIKASLQPGYLLGSQGVQLESPQYRGRHQDDCKCPTLKNIRHLLPMKPLISICVLSTIAQTTHPPCMSLSISILPYLSPFPCLFVRNAQRHFPVKSPSSTESWVQCVWPTGRSDDQNLFMQHTPVQFCIETDRQTRCVPCSMGLR